MPRLSSLRKSEAALLREVSEVADQVCNGMLVTSAAMPLKNGDGFGGPRNMIDFIGHASLNSTRAKCGLS
jgi:hypothetical protein